MSDMDQTLAIEVLEARLEMEAMAAGGAEQFLLPIECWCNER